ncbi:MAG: hypothetical protein HUJ25_07760 [Crocinitomicaceae bacterium]|nr:hypothetical protein [Crocinitomicaceae bacterium]
MNNSLKFVLVFIASVSLMFMIFYFYPAKIFDVKLIGKVAEEATEVHLTAFLGLDHEFKNELAVTHVEMERKLAGWMIMFICFIGLPTMIAYRLTLDKKKSSAEEQN